MRRPRVVIDDVEYEVVDAAVGLLCSDGQSFHQHAFSHDGVPAGDSHHHHTETCHRIRAVLLPVCPEPLPPEIVVRHGREWEAVPTAEASLHG